MLTCTSRTLMLHRCFTKKRYGCRGPSDGGGTMGWPIDDFSSLLNHIPGKKGYILQISSDYQISFINMKKCIMRLFCQSRKFLQLLLVPHFSQRLGFTGIYMLQDPNGKSTWWKSWFQMFGGHSFKACFYNAFSYEAIYINPCRYQNMVV